MIEQQKRLKKVLVLDKQQNPERIKELINCDIKKILENFFEIKTNNLKTEIIVDENGINIYVRVLADRMKDIGTLPSFI